MAGTILITGGSRGIGAATALLAARRGHPVCLGHRRDPDDTLRATLAAIEATGVACLAVQADLRSEDAVEDLFDRCADALGAPIGVVNSAGIPGPRGRLAEMDPEGIRKVVETNLLGTLLVCRAALRRMGTDAGGAGGAIVNLSSQVARSGGRLLSVYTATKGAVNALTLALAPEAAAIGVRINAVSPGIIATSQHPLDDADWVQRTADRIPMGRLGRPEEVAETILWLLSDASSYVTGEVVGVAGGRAAH